MRAQLAILVVFVGAADTGRPTVATSEATALGTTAMSMNGTVHPHALPTTCHFEYGPTPAYGSKTAEQPLPPRLAAYYHESWDEGLGGWQTWLRATHHTSGGPSGGYVNFAEPSKNDDNHDDGIGTLHLVKFLYPGPMNPSHVSLGGGDPDLRDARVTVWARGHDYLPHGAEIVWWSQSQSNPELGNNKGWRRANWAYTGTPLTDFLLDGKWHKIEYRLLNDTTQWTYGGNNPTRQGPSAARYAYWPIDDTQQHCNGDFFHLAAFIDVDKPPTGSIDFDEFELVYRNRSLLFPANGGKLVSSPRSPAADAAALTDGWRFGPAHAWQSAENPRAPLEFVYSFAGPVTIRTVQVHQNPEWPAPNANFAFAAQTGLEARARFLKASIRSGYGAKRWGLGEIEAFGTGAAMLPEDEPNHVNADAAGLRPGTTYHYRLVAASQAGTSYGEDRAFTTPADTRPLASTGRASRIDAHSAKLEGRINPLGLRAQFWFEYGTDARYGSRTPARYGGLQITPRSAYAAVEGLRPGTVYHYRLAASNATGT
ncbi:MAG: hypothetical protein DMG07_23160, partial [Acidobacteria bacterium]